MILLPRRFFKLLKSNKAEVGGVTGFTLAAGNDEMSVPNQVTYYTQAVPVGKSVYFGLWVKTTSTAGTPSLQIDYEQSYSKPTTEYAADTNFVIPDGASAIFTNLNDEIAHVKQISPVPMTYIRLKITGLAGNQADSLLTAKLFTQSIY